MDSPFTPLLNRQHANGYAPLEDENVDRVPLCPLDYHHQSEGLVSLDGLAAVVRREIQNAIRPVEGKLASLHTVLNTRMDSMEGVLQQHDVKIAKLEDLIRDHDGEKIRLEMQEKIDEKNWTCRNRLTNSEVATPCQLQMWRKLWWLEVCKGLIPCLWPRNGWHWRWKELQGPMHTGFYMKTLSFQGLMFVKFRNGYERDLAIGILRSARLKHGDDNVWATQDLPIPVRARKLFLMSLRWQLGEWGFVKKEFEIDDLYTHLRVGGKVVLKVSTADGNLKLQWDDAWAIWGDLQQSPELQAILDKSKEFLTSEEREQERAKPQALRRLDRDNSARDKVFHSRKSLVHQPVLRKISRHLHAPRIYFTMCFPKMLEYIHMFGWTCSRIVQCWLGCDFMQWNPKCTSAVAFWMAGMFYTHRKLQHKQLEWPYCCTENMCIELGRWHRSMRDLCFWICIMDVIVFDSFHCICSMQDIHWRTCELLMICYTLSWMKLRVYTIK